MSDPPRFNLSQTTIAPVRVNQKLDPRLQYYVARQQSGIVKVASASTMVDEVAVIARVSSPADWEALSEVRQPTLVGSTLNNDYIVTGRIPIRRIEAIRGQAFVKSLKASQTLRPSLKATTKETEAEPKLLPAKHKAKGGRGVVVGIIDYGADFVHQNFRHTDGTTRIIALWNQDGPISASSPFGYGQEFDSKRLDHALQKRNPYQALGYDPAVFENPRDPGTHGTHVMDIAAGNGQGTGVPGMAPEADLIFVNISHADAPEGAGTVGQSFGDSVRLLEALKFIFDRAGNKPCVVNISLGTNGGPHDGSTLVEQGIDSLLRAAPNRAVTISAGNAFDDHIHAAGAVLPGQTITLEWEIVTSLRADIEMEIWYPGADRFTVELIGPNGITLATVGPDASQTLAAEDQIAMFIANRLNDPNNHDNMIGVFFAAGMPAGTYKVRLHGDQVTDGRFHAWIERDNRFHSQFTPPYDNAYTIGSISCGHLSIAVGSYDAHKLSRPLSYFSSAGPTRDGRQKPEVSAPGHDVLAAKSSTGSRSRLMSGTSMAAPAVAGLIALMLAEARARKLDLTIDQIRDILIATARRNPPPEQTWHSQYGHGRVLAAAAVQQIMKGVNNENSV